jgi:hypothetical protein
VIIRPIPIGLMLIQTALTSSGASFGRGGASNRLNYLFTNDPRRFLANHHYRSGLTSNGDCPMNLPVADRATADTATMLMASFGDLASAEAASRADQSRDQGNALLFCRWRQVERLVALLSTNDVHGTVQ